MDRTTHNGDIDMTRKGQTPQILSPEYEYIRDASLELGLSPKVALAMHKKGALTTALVRYGTGAQKQSTRPDLVNATLDALPVGGLFFD